MSISKVSKRLRRAGVWQQIILSLLAFITLYPFAFMLFTSLKTNKQFFGQFWLPTFPLHFENYAQVAPRVLLYIGNSLLYSVPTLLLVLVLSLLAGYAFGRFRFFGREVLFMLMLSLLMLPGVLILIPLFIQMRDVGWLNTPQGIILPWVAFEIVFATFIMRVFFEKLPKEIFEAARIDGASQLRVLWGVAIPLALPGLGTIAILNVLFSWNDIIWPLVSLFDRDSYPVSIGVLGFQGQYQTEYGPLFAAYTLSCLPLIVFFVFTVRQFIEGFEGGLSL